MSQQNRRGGYLATAEGVKKLKKTKGLKKYTYDKIAEKAQETLDKVKRLFNPQWGNGKYKIGEEAVEAICRVLDLQPKDIVSDWYAVEIPSPEVAEEKLGTEDKSNIDTASSEVLRIEVLRRIEQVARDGVEELDLSGMGLSELPPEIGKLSKLKKLILGSWKKIASGWISNSLSSLPPKIGQLTNLIYLDLYNNTLNSLPPEIGQLTNLTVLYLNSNALNSLPSEIGQLTNLTVLHLGGNSLSSLPPEIGQLTNLRVLYLGRNSLSSLPPEIRQLSNLTKLYLDSNPLPIPPEILKKFHEPVTIVNYYLSLQSSQKKPLNEAKMLLVGQGNVGKTCLKERLIRNQYDPRRNKTDGIDIETWNIEIDERQIQVNVWDFGGQEIMHSTHQFFLTKRSLYLLVVDTTLGEEENRIEYWLKIIQSFGKDSPVIIVGNKADRHPLDIDKRSLQQKYPQIKAFMETSCATGTGIEALQEVVTKELSQLEHIDDQLPLTWFNIKKQLEDLDKDYISYDRYESICEIEGVKEEDNQSTLIQFLHDLGVVLNFKDDDRLQDTHVLKPEWVTNGVYKILNDHQLIVEHKGILDRETLSRILENDKDHKYKYPRNKQMFIIRMMRKFELCFNVEPDQKFLIPDILPKEEPPDIGEWENALAFEYHYPVLPGSIISRFIVRMNHYIHQQAYWRSGVVLAKEENTALVKADREDKKIIICINGQENTRRDLLAAIRFQFDDINKSIPGIVPEEKVPLIARPEIVLDYQELLGLEAMGETSIAIGRLGKRIPLKQLLDGIEESSKRKKEDRENDRD